jgi:hypothetical protein
MSEQKVSKNDRSLLNLHRYLIDIIKNPEVFNDKLDLSSLKSQGNLAKIENEEYEILPTSLNTLKRRSPDLFPGGFTELETLRNQAYDAISKLREPVKAKPKDSMDSIKQLELEVENLKRSQILMTTLFLDNLKTIEGIQSINSMEIIKKQLADLSKKMKSYGLLDSNLLILTETSNIIPLNKVKK